MKRSIQRQLPPERVEIFLELFINDSPPQKQLPFKLAILSALSGDPNPEKPAVTLAKRRFIDITEETFDKVMAEIGPYLSLRFAQPLAGKGPQSVDLKFSSIDDFRPERIAEQVPYLNTLLQERQRLSELLTRAYGNPKLVAFLVQMARDPDLLQRVLAEVRHHEEEKQRQLVSRQSDQQQNLPVKQEEQS